jgi:hypothetical protein
MYPNSRVLDDPYHLCDHHLESNTVYCDEPETDCVICLFFISTEYDLIKEGKSSAYYEYRKRADHLISLLFIPEEEEDYEMDIFG